MSVHDVLSAANEQGVYFYLKNGKLAYKAKKGSLSEQIKQQILKHRTDIVDYLQRNDASKPHLVLPPIKAASREHVIPLSFAQQSLWFMDQFGQGSAQFNISGCFVINGQLNMSAFEQAVAALLERHEVLRTLIKTDNGEAHQVILPKYDLPLQHHDFCTLTDEQKREKLLTLMHIQARRSFDLACDLKLRVLLVTLSNREHLVFYVMHHIASDARSKLILARELNELYVAFDVGKANPLPRLPVQYADFALWQRNWLQGDALGDSLDYWKKQLADLPVVHSLPLDRSRPPQQSFIGDAFRLKLDRHLSQQITHFAKQHNVTLFMFMHTALAVQLYRNSGAQDIVVGSAISGRNLKDVESLIGFFINDILIRTQLDGTENFTALLDKQKQNILDAYAHQHVPFELLVEELNPQRSLSYNPLYQIKLDVQNNAQKDTSLPQPLPEDISKDKQQQDEAYIENSQAQGIKQDLYLSVTEQADGIVLFWRFSSDLFDAATIERLAEQFNLLLAGIVETPLQPVNSLALLNPEQESHLLQEGYGPDTFAHQGKCLHQLFELQTEKTPGAVAVSMNDDSLSYAQLNTQANQLAHYLIDKGVKPDTLIGICTERSIEMMIGILGVLKAGGAYVAIDPKFPQSRLEMLLDSCDCQWLLTHSDLLSELSFGDRRTVPLDDNFRIALFSKYQDTNPIPAELNLTPSNLAYMIYTSGSTGHPKGVMVEHQGVVKYLEYAQGYYYNSDLVGSLVATSYSFDLTVPTLFLPLLNGGQVKLLNNGTELEELAAYLANTGQALQEGYLLRLTPSHIQGFLSLLLDTGQAVQSDVKHTLVIGGEPLQMALVAELRSLLPKAKLYNHYGPTEAVIGSSIYTIPTTESIAGPSKYCPIGRAIGHRKLMVLDVNHKLVPVGTAGELYIGGCGLARGYYHDPDLSAQRFVEDAYPSHDGEKMYQTGDLVRWLSDGNLEFIGRTDKQVKIRGLRIEPSEIEHSLMCIESIRACAVLVRKVADKEQQLIAYIVSSDSLLEDGQDETAYIQHKESLIHTYHDQLSKKLPEYMVPQVYLFLDKLPLSANGKLDPNALPEPEESDLLKAKYIAPRNTLEETLCGLWQQVLKLTQIGIEDDFFLMGGHSLLATRLINLVRQELGVELPLKSLFEFPTVAKFSSLIESGYEDFMLPPIVQANRNQSIPLSYAQQRLWFIDQLGEGSLEYNVPGRFVMEGDFNVTAFEQAIKALIDRHEVLRTHFVLDAEEAQQMIVKDYELPVQHHDLSELSEQEKFRRINTLMQQEAQTMFDLSADLMLRVRLLRLSENEHFVLYTMHHIASDGWSRVILQDEFKTLYEAFYKHHTNPLTPLRIQYADYALWQRNWLQGDVLAKHLNYWKQQLAGIPQVHRLPLDRPRPKVQCHKGRAYIQTINQATTERIATYCRQQGVTLYMFLHTAFSILLSRYSGETDIVVGSPIAGRTHKDLESLIGFFVNSLVIRSDLSNDPSFSQLLGENKQTILDAYTHQHVPFEMLVEKIRPDRNISHNALFQILFVVQNNEKKSLDLQGVATNSDSLSEVSELNVRFELALHVTETADELSLRWSYRTSLFADDSIARMAVNFEVLLQSILHGLDVADADEEPAISELNLISDNEKHLLLSEWMGDEVSYPQDKCLHELFENQVSQTPDNVAVIDENSQLTYAQLNKRANQLAHFLIEQGIEPDSIVAISAKRSVETMIGLLGILKAGAGYLPLDADYPVSRINYMLDDCQVERILVNRIGHIDGLDMQGREMHCIDDKVFSGILRGYDEANPLPATLGLGAQHLAYVIYTSGSTGQPKGVLINHAALCNFVQCAKSLFLKKKIEGSVVSSSLSFDATVQSLYVPLIGGQYVEFIADNELLINHLVDYVVDDDAALLFKITPTHLKAMANLSFAVRNPNAEHVFVVAGEQLTKDSLKPWYLDYLPAATFINEYGPTEATVGSCIFEVQDSLIFSHGGDAVPIGKPLHNVQCYVLSPKLDLQPIGVAGELYIAGAGLARGYLNQTALTEQRFIANPYSADSHAKLYKTGDLVRWLEDGNIEFIKRIDDQIKIRGLRIELGEIEALLASQPALNGAVVSVNKKDNDNQLIAYICPSTDYLLDVSRTYNQEHVNQWTAVNDEKYAEAEAYVEQVELNFFGWNSSYSDQAIPQEQMEEWLKYTMIRIEQLNPKRLLEIGCGQGLLLYRYAEHCEQVHALDISAVALAGIQAQVNQRQWHHVKLQQGDALSIDNLVDGEFDTVVINSVVQYFPNQLYLEKVIDKLIPCIAEGGQILIGDVRNLDLFAAHLAAIEMSHLTQSCPISVMANRIQRRILQEPELLVSPSFFIQMQARIPQISQVDILVKRGVGDNEMIRYRYDVVLKIATPATTTDTLNSPNWQPYHSLEDIETRIEQGEPSFAIAKIPNQRVEGDLAWVKATKEWDPERLLYPLEYASLLNQPASAFVARLESILDEARKRGYRCELTWSQDRLDCMDLLVSRQALPAVQAKGNYLQSYLVNFPQLATVGRELAVELRQQLEFSLPDYMIPSVFIAMEQLPLTVSGKVNKNALPLPEESDIHKNDYVAPGNAVEHKLCELWQDLLNIELVGINDNFFFLGGHSLLATQLISAIRQAFCVELPLRTLFESPTIAELSLKLDVSEGSIVLPPVKLVDKSGALPLSHAQQRLWFIDRLDNGSTQYNMPGRYILEGEFNQTAFRRALVSLIERHQVLRTRFVQHDGDPCQIIVDDFELPFSQWDLSAKEESEKQRQLVLLMQKAFDTPFDLSADLMLRVCHIKLSAELHLILYTLHHIAGDGWSRSILQNELNTLYEAYCEQRPNPLGALTIQYADYAVWQRSWLQGEVLDEGMQYWKKQLAGLPLTHGLPLDQTRPERQTFNGRVYHQLLDKTLVEKISTACRMQDVTLFMFLQTAFALLISRYSNETDILMGTPVAGRNHVDIEPLIGFFVNTLVIRTDLSGEPSFAELLRNNKDAILNAYKYQYMPFEMLVDELCPQRDMSHNPLIQILFTVQNNRRGSFDQAMQKMRQQQVSEDANGNSQMTFDTKIKFELEINVHEQGEQLQIRWGYNTVLFADASIQRFAANYRVLLESILASLVHGFASRSAQQPGLASIVSANTDKGQAPLVSSDLLSVSSRQLTKQLETNYPETRFWQCLLGNAGAPLCLPYDCPPATSSTSICIAEKSKVIERSLSIRLQTLCRKQGASFQSGLFTLYGLLLARLGGQNSLLIAVPGDGDAQPYLDSEKTPPLNILPVPFDLSTEINFAQLLKTTHAIIGQCRAHQPLHGDLVEQYLPRSDRQNSTATINTAFALTNVARKTRPGGSGHNSGRGTSWQQEDWTTLFDLSGQFSESLSGVTFTLVYNEMLFSAQAIEGLLVEYHCLLEALIKSPEQALNRIFLPQEQISRLKLIDQAEQPLLATEHVPHTVDNSVTVQGVFATWATKQPDTIALISDNQQLTYAQLQRRSNQLAHYLLASGVRFEQPIGLCFTPSCELLIAVLGILKAGACYVPLNSSEPLIRLGKLIKSGELSLILTHCDTQSKLNQALVWNDRERSTSETVKVQVMNIEHEPRLLSQKDSLPEVAVTAMNLACIQHQISAKGELVVSRFSHNSLTTLAALWGKHRDIGPSGYLVSLNEADINLASWDWITAICCGCTLQLPPQYQNETAASEQELTFGGSRKVLNAAATNVPFFVPQAVIDVAAAGIYTLIDENTEALVLNYVLEKVPLGGIGELCIPDYGVRGYSRARLTAEHFIPHPTASKPGQRLYRSGALVHFNADRSFEYLGQTGQQIRRTVLSKDLQAVQSLVLQNPQVQDALVVQDDNAERISYLLHVESTDTESEQTEKQGISAQVLDYLRGQPELLPLPVKLIAHDTIPAELLDSRLYGNLESGWTDSHTGQTTYSAPRNHSEEVLCGIWREVLDLKQVGIDDNFFAIGGNSLIATRLVSLVRSRMNIELQLAALFEAPTIAQLSQVLCVDSKLFVLPPVERANRQQRLPLSYAQQRLWFIDQLGDGSTQYNINGRFRLDGQFNLEAFDRAVYDLLMRHEVLRTRYKVVDEDAVQVISDSIAVPVSHYDLSHLAEQDKATQIRQYVKHQAQKAFNLADDLMLRVVVLKLAQQQHLIIYAMHHIASDGWSIGIFQQELKALYQAYCQGLSNPLKPLAVQYADYALWQQNWLQGQLLDGQLGYWRKQLAELPALHSLALDKPRPAQQVFDGRRVEIVVNQATSQAIHALCEQQEVTLFMLLQTAFALLLGRYSNETDIVVGSPIAGRTHRDIESLIGFFINTLVLRTDLSGDPSFYELLKRNKGMILDAYAHQHIPFEMLVNELSPHRQLSYNPLAQILFTLQNNERGMETLLAQKYDSSRRCQDVTKPRDIKIKFDLELTAVEMESGIVMVWGYNTALFDDQSIARIATNMLELLGSIVQHNIEPASQKAISALSVVSNKDRCQLQSAPLNTWVNGVQSVDSPFIHQLFAERAESCPDAIALIYEDQQLSYAELDRRANRLAHFLIAQGIGPDICVGLCIERSVDMLITLLAILKAGGCYLPLDPEYPQDRLAYMLEDSKASSVLISKAVKNSNIIATLIQSKAELNWMVIENETQALGVDFSVPDVALGPLNLCYLIYTSGSTGKPKAVAVTHQGWANLAVGQHQIYGLSSQVRKLQFASVSFDAAAFEICMSIMAGGALCLISSETSRSTDWLAKTLKAQCLTHATLPPAILAYLNPDENNLQTLIVAGEAISRDAAQNWSKGRQLHNAYGPTETTVCATSGNYQHGIPHIGYPLQNKYCYVLDKSGAMAPLGALGELYVGGAQLARGYLGKAALSAERFVPNPFTSIAGDRLYRTGDIVRYRSDGALEFIGRVDEQTKIRGFRVELGEIEHCLLSCDDILACSVIAYQTVGDDKHLAAYLVTHQESGQENSEDPQKQPSKRDRIQQYKSWLSHKLPAYMIPQSYVFMDALPLTASGKVDKRALPEPDEADLLKVEYVAPSNPVEKALCEHWQGVLKLELVGIDDDFFALGGHSLLATRLTNLMRREFKLEIPLRALFKSPTVRQMARHIFLQNAQQQIIANESELQVLTDDLDEGEL